MPPWARECSWGFFVGPDKAGSSWMQGVLERHPGVVVPAAKDLHFFNRFHRRGLDWYLRQFDPAPQTRTAVEVCHDYLFDEQAIIRIADTFPTARIVVCARHPAERAVSAYLYLVRQGRTRLDLATALREIDELVDHGRYHHYLTTVLAHIDRERVTVLDFAELQRDPAAFKAHLLAGLGAPPHDPTPEDLVPVRVAARPRSRAAARAGKLGAGLLRRLRAEQVLGRLKASPVVERALFAPYASKERPVLTRADLGYLRRVLEADARGLDSLFGTRFAREWWQETDAEGTERSR
jgi:hypothetical protein